MSAPVTAPIAPPTAAPRTLPVAAAPIKAPEAPPIPAPCSVGVQLAIDKPIITNTRALFIHLSNVHKARQRQRTPSPLCSSILCDRYCNTAVILKYCAECVRLRQAIEIFGGVALQSPISGKSTANGRSQRKSIVNSHCSAIFCLELFKGRAFCRRYAG